MRVKAYPSISIIIPAHNESRNLKKLFLSLRKQTYPKKKTEYLVIDDGSTDDTSSISQKFGAEVMSVKTGDIGENKRIGLRRARNELVYCIDADIELCKDNFFELLVTPFRENPKVIGSFTNEFAMDKNLGAVRNSLLRCLSYNPTQEDPLYEFLTTQVGETIISRHKEYFLCSFRRHRVPAVGRVMYRRNVLLEIQEKNPERIMDLDLDTTALVTHSGHSTFAYVPEAALRHYHALNLRQFIRKRIRNLKINYLPQARKKSYLWFNPKNPSDVLRILGWILWVNLFIPELLVSIIAAFRYKDVALLWRPVLAIAATDAILFTFLTLPSGRSFIVSTIRGFSHEK